LPPDERLLANRLAKQSQGKYSQEEIENAMRVLDNQAKGENITAGMVLVDPGAPGAIYDHGASWTAGQDGSSLVQVLPNVNPEVIAYVREQTGGLSSPYMPPVFELMPDSSVNLGNGRDRLTQLPLDEQGRYSRQIVVGGKAYEPKYWPCATAECVSGAQNLDMTDPGTQAFVKALDAQVFKDIGTGTAIATLAFPIGAPAAVLTGTGVMASIGSAATDSNIQDELLKEASQYTAMKFFQEVLNHPPAAAARAVALIELAGGWDSFVGRLKKDLGISDEKK
jgi:hypothetical protein